MIDNAKRVWPRIAIGHEENDSVESGVQFEILVLQLQGREPGQQRLLIELRFCSYWQTVVSMVAKASCRHRLSPRGPYAMEEGVRRWQNTVTMHYSIYAWVTSVGYLIE
jgi:hypothetical protein